MISLKVLRRIRDKSTGVIDMREEEVTLVRENDRSVWVMLENGDVIKRKKRDVVGEGK